MLRPIRLRVVRVNAVEINRMRDNSLHTGDTVACCFLLLLPSVPHCKKHAMGSRVTIELYVLTLVVVVVGVDVLFLRHLFWERLIVNVGIVAAFGVFALRFRKRP